MFPAPVGLVMGSVEALGPQELKHGDSSPIEGASVGEILFEDEGKGHHEPGWAAWDPCKVTEGQKGA